MTLTRTPIGQSTATRREVQATAPKDNITPLTRSAARRAARLLGEDHASALPEDRSASVTASPEGEVSPSDQDRGRYENEE